MGFAICAALNAAGPAQAAGPFDQLAGQWSGNGTISLSNGTQEAIHCRATYDLLSETNVQLKIRCASDSFVFDLAGNVHYQAGGISGVWSESTRNAGGTLSGNTRGDNLQVVANSPTFSASLSLTTRRNAQAVEIKSHNQDSKLSGVSIRLRRGGEGAKTSSE